MVNAGTLNVRAIPSRGRVVEGERDALGIAKERLDSLVKQTPGDSVGFLARSGDGGVAGTKLVAQFRGTDPTRDGSSPARKHSTQEEEDKPGR
jgi:hypothetical protein